jgi:hypothetical protein
MKARRVEVALEGMVDMVVKDDEDEKGYEQDVPIGPDMLSMSSMSDTLIIGATFPTASRTEKHMEPYSTLQGLVDSRIAGGSLDAGTKRRWRMNMRSTSVFSW